MLSAILAGKHRMLVDIRDAELTRDPNLFVEFIELAILPVAAGLEGLDNNEYVRNRVKVCYYEVQSHAYAAKISLTHLPICRLSSQLSKI